MKNKNLFNRKGLKSFRSLLRNKVTSDETALWDILKSKQLDGDLINHPGRKTDFAILRLSLYCGHPSFKRRGKYY